MSTSSIEVFRSPERRACDERALVLLALDIPSTILYDGFDYTLLVEPAEALRARSELRHYEIERRPLPPPPRPPPPLPNAWVGCALYALTLVAIGLAVSNGLWRLDAFDRGALDDLRVQQGQLWRAWTALTLHLDGAHLIANLAAGIWFCYLAAAQIGAGSSWLLIVSGAAIANLIEALLGPAAHVSVGASTAVFTALGLLAAHAWRQRRSWTQQRWALRWAPLVGGVVLLGWFGTGGDAGDITAGEAAPVLQVDIVAHALGFLVGGLLGVAAAQPPLRVWLSRAPQWALGLAAWASIAIAWSFALAR
ncbi:MAG TPA: rhomboid family intramembrane serine protease [Steroidobacteraceae bacterium]|jgi:membrane associated rhomboid family serine protease